MKSLNNVQIIGNLGAEPETKDLDGKVFTKFSVATGEEWLDKNTMEKKTNTEWHRVTCFGKLAQLASDHLKKGMRVYVSGKLKTSKWQDKENKAHQITEIIADDFIMLNAMQ